jgi:NitT/TauT family transport system ATP-binding protein
VKALEPTDLEVQESEFLTIVGPSGCGKSTLLMIASGLETPSAGTIEVSGRPAGKPGPDRSVVFQQFALFPHMSVTQNIEYGLKVARVKKADRKAAVAQQIAVMGLDGFQKAYPSELSGGMQQRVAIARALVLEPSLLFMDEPFGALDAQTRTQMQDEMAKLRTRMMSTVLFVTHSVEEAVFLGTRIIVMSARPGRIIANIPIANDAPWKGLAIEAAMGEPAFNSLREKVWNLLHTKVE